MKLKKNSLKNDEKIHELIKKNKDVIIVLGHYGNWEGLLASFYTLMPKWWVSINHYLPHFGIEQLKKYDLNLMPPY